MFSQQASDWICRSLKLKSFEASQLQGSTSSSLYLLRSDRQAYVLRVLDNPDWLLQEPDLILHEAAILEALSGKGLLVPELLAFSQEELGLGAPALLMSYLPGKVELLPDDFEAWLKEIATALSQIHRLDLPDFGWRFKSWVRPELVQVPRWSRQPAAWQQAIAWWQNARQSHSEIGQPVLIHRDFHPANLLWQDQQLTGVVDWINACQGPEGVDLAHCRSNLMQMYGLSVADRFLASYCILRPEFIYDPFWDLDCLFDTCLPEPSFYQPWQVFGLERISQESLQERVEQYLLSLLPRLNAASAMKF